MEINIRSYRPADAKQVIEVFRDSFNTLRKSRGGAHPDAAVDKFLDASDREILGRITRGAVLLVAEVKETGEIAGTGAVTNRPVDRLLNSTYSRTHYVKEKFQHGKTGVNIGSMLRRATIQKARDLGFRKIYGYSLPESVGFHKKFGAKYLPRYNFRYLEGAVEVHYYEIELRPSIRNSIRIEPYIFRLSKWWQKHTT